MKNLMDSYDDLQIALNVAKDNLKDLNDNIRRVAGREIAKNDPLSRKRPFRDREGTNMGFRNEGPNVNKRRTNPEVKSVFSRLSSNNNEEKEVFRPKVSSRVFKEMPSREEVVAAQSDEQSRARNKRIFGSLLGTLNRFCQEESRLKPKVEKKAQIEKKVEEQEIRERETMKQERRNLYIDRKKKQIEIKMLEIKMNRMQEHETWEELQKPLSNYIKTKAEPKIFFLPKVHTEKTTQLLEDSKKAQAEELQQKRERVHRELEEMETNYKTQLSREIENNKMDGEDAAMADMAEDEVPEGYPKSIVVIDPKRTAKFENSRSMKTDSEGEIEEEEDEEEEEQRPRIESRIVRSKVEVQGGRHVLHSNNKKMIISVVNDRN